MSLVPLEQCGPYITLGTKFHGHAQPACPSKHIQIMTGFFPRVSNVHSGCKKGHVYLFFIISIQPHGTNASV